MPVPQQLYRHKLMNNSKIITALADCILTRRKQHQVYTCLLDAANSHTSLFAETCSYLVLSDGLEMATIICEKHPSSDRTMEN